MHLSRLITFSIILITLLALNGSTTFAEEAESRLEKALEAAGDNQAELKKVINHYTEAGDQQMLDAARFLIENMEGHCFVTYILHDTTGEEVPFDVLAYPDFDSLMAAVKVIEDTVGELDYRRDEKIDDLPTVTADFLIEQIDYAFKAWREKPWAGFLNFDQFCEYVLPYRGSNEPLENWRRYFYEKYGPVATEMADSTDVMEAAALINNDIRSWFKFDPRYYFHPTDQGLDEMIQNKMGRCEDMTNLTIYAMRANGLAVTSDYTPYWANSGNNHAWNAILTGDGQVVPFMGAEANPGEYQLANKLAKVYRKTYSTQPENLVFQEKKQEKVPRWLAGKNYVDVTVDYTPVSDVAVKFEQPVPDSVDIAYLCVFNSGEWKAIQWGRITDGVAIFSDMGRDIAYLPAIYINEEIVPYAPPFIITNSALVKQLIPSETDKTELLLTSTTARKQEISTDGIEKSSLTPGISYELFYWDGEWQSLGEEVAGESPLKFEDVPEGALYWLVAEGSDKEERIFTIRGDRQVWW